MDKVTVLHKALARDSNIELYRIILMLLIISHHFVFHTGLFNLSNNYPKLLNSQFLLIFGAWGKTAINGFVLITGYYMCKSHITMRKFLKLICEIEFYKIIICLVFLAGGVNMPIHAIVKNISPIDSIHVLFPSSYLLFFLLIPFINVLIQHLSQKRHLILIAFLVFMYSIIGSLPLFTLTFNYVTWFCVIFLIGSYLRLYNFPHKNDVSFWGKCTLCLITTASISISIFSFINIGYIDSYYLVADVNKPFALLIGISSFLFFKNLNMPHYKIINSIAACTFGVFLIHDNSDEMRSWLWHDIIDFQSIFQTDTIYAYAMILPVVIFITCATIDFLRSRFLECPILNVMFPIAENIKTKFLSYINKFVS